ncbi:exodeoxyribonuclease III [Methanoregula sp.]|uniref:exodeoxyribonuclease III n=1 Tax=Methanoregula sp. TaxID=2052170 RepID=UPI002C3192B6|nr:exodeoxyribonuclease III [Methanoregula sp.]HVP96747.1 exodeoxyribonuclease III [Methanoregula sp.]
MTKIISWNVNGLKHVMDNGFLKFINEENPDIICLQETKLKEPAVAKIFEPLTRSYSLNCTSSVREDKFPYSGVATLSKKKPSWISKTFGSNQFDMEGRILISEYPDFVLYNCYFPTGASKPKYQDMKRAFYSECYSALNKSIDEGKSVIICGDFNTARDVLDVANASQKKKTSGFLPEDRDDLEKLFSLGLVDAFRKINADRVEYTWWHNYPGVKEKNLGWRIDYFLVSPDLENSIKDCSHKKETFGSDHCPILLEIS